MEFNLNNINKHIAYLAADEVTEICQPLFTTFNLNYFGYHRVYPDNSLVALVSNRDWVYCFVENEYFKQKVPFTFKEGMHLNSSYLPEEVVRTKINDFNHDSWLNIAKDRQDYIEYFDIAAPVDNKAAIELYFSRADVLNNFLLYFKEKASDLIDKAVKERVSMGYSPIISDPFANISIEAFLEQIKTKKVRLNYGAGEVVLTRREYEILLQFAAGRMAKEVANALNISPKTVEHRLENARIRNRLSKSNLIVAVRDNLIGLLK